MWGAIQEMVIVIANLFDLTDKEILDAMINHPEEFAHLFEFYKLKLTSWTDET